MVLRSHQETTMNLALPVNCLQRIGVFFSASRSHFEGLSLERTNLEPHRKGTFRRGSWLLPASLDCGIGSG